MVRVIHSEVVPSFPDGKEQDAYSLRHANPLLNNLAVVQHEDHYTCSVHDGLLGDIKKFRCSQGLKNVVSGEGAVWVETGEGVILKFVAEGKFPERNSGVRDQLNIHDEGSARDAFSTGEMLEEIGKTDLARKYYQAVVHSQAAHYIWDALGESLHSKAKLKLLFKREIAMDSHFVQDLQLHAPFYLDVVFDDHMKLEDRVEAAKNLLTLDEMREEGKKVLRADERKKVMTKLVGDALKLPSSEELEVARFFEKIGERDAALRVYEDLGRADTEKGVVARQVLEKAERREALRRIYLGVLNDGDPIMQNSDWKQTAGAWLLKYGTPEDRKLAKTYLINSLKTLACCLYNEPNIDGMIEIVEILRPFGSAKNEMETWLKQKRREVILEGKRVRKKERVEDRHSMDDDDDDDLENDLDDDPVWYFIHRLEEASRAADLEKKGVAKLLESFGPLENVEVWLKRVKRILAGKRRREMPRMRKEVRDRINDFRDRSSPDRWGGYFAIVYEREIADQIARRIALDKKEDWEMRLKAIEILTEFESGNDIVRRVLEEKFNQAPSDMDKYWVASTAKKLGRSKQANKMFFSLLRDEKTDLSVRENVLSELNEGEVTKEEYINYCKEITRDERTSNSTIMSCAKYSDKIDKDFAKDLYLRVALKEGGVEDQEKLRSAAELVKLGDREKAVGAYQYFIGHAKDAAYLRRAVRNLERLNRNAAIHQRFKRKDAR